MPSLYELQFLSQNPTIHNVIVEEDLMRERYIALHRRMSELEEHYRTYLALLLRMRLFVIRSGKTAQSLSYFIEAAKGLSGSFDAVASDFEELSASFIREVDEADGALAAIAVGSLSPGSSQSSHTNTAARP